MRIYRSLLCILLANILLIGPAIRAEGSEGILKDAIPEDIEFGDITVELVPFVQAPRTDDASKPTIKFGETETLLATNNAYARLQYMMPLPDGSGRLAFNDIRGVLYFVDRDGGNLTTYLDVRNEVPDLAENIFPNEVGLMGFAFHPDFGEKGRPGYGKFYTGYSATKESGEPLYMEDEAQSHHTVLREWTTTDHLANDFEGTSREVFRVGQFNMAHNIGNLAFNRGAVPKSSDYGMLYFSMGDGGSAFDPKGNGQDIATPLAALLRISPLADNKKPYSIPADNPFVDTPNAAPEIWAFGLRHVQHFSFSKDGTLFLNDIGQNQIEEVNIGIRGANYGWNVREGTFLTGAGVEGGSLPYLYPLVDRNDDFTYPVAQYDHDDLSNAIGAGFLYEGDAIPALRGMYVFSDLVQGRLFYADLSKRNEQGLATILELRTRINGKNQALKEILAYENTYAPIPRVDLRLGTDSEGEIYTLSKGDGKIRKIVLAGQ